MDICRPDNRAQIMGVFHIIQQKNKWRFALFFCLPQNIDLNGAIGLVIGGEGEGVGRLVKEKCDFTASIPMDASLSLPVYN